MHIPRFFYRDYTILCMIRLYLEVIKVFYYVINFGTMYPEILLELKAVIGSARPFIGKNSWINYKP